MTSFLHRLRVKFPGLSPECLKGVFLKSREFDAGLRAFPDFLVIGAQKSGSTSLFNYLCLHPRVQGSFPKEIFYFSREFERGERWYRRHFPRRSYLEKHEAVTGEATTMYLCSADAPGRVAALLPDVKLIAVLREPAARAVSHFNHRRRTGAETRQVNEVFSADTIRRFERGDQLAEPDALYFERGDYAANLIPWLACFSPEHLLILEAEEMFADPPSVVARVLSFIGLDPVPLTISKAFNSSASGLPKPEQFAALRNSFSQRNQKLRELGFSMSWSGYEHHRAPMERQSNLGRTPFPRPSKDL